MLGNVGFLVTEGGHHVDSTDLGDSKRATDKDSAEIIQSHKPARYF